MAANRWGFVAIALCFASGPALAGTQVSSPAGQARATISPLGDGSATVVVERRDGGGWRPAWRGALRNDVAPDGAILTDNGRLLVFDDKQAILLLDAQGRVVLERQLGDFLPAAYVHALPRGERGLQWRRAAKLARGQGQVEFSVPAPGSAAGATGPALHFSIDLRDGGVRTAQIREYLAAVDQAKLLEARAARATRERTGPAQLASSGTPLPAPALSR